MDAFKHVTHHPNRHQHRRPSGFSFIEILVALFLLATGLLSLSVFHIVNLKTYQHNYQLLQGRALLQYGAEFMLALRSSNLSSKNVDLNINNFLLSIEPDDQCRQVHGCEAQFCSLQQLALVYQDTMVCLTKQINPNAVLNSHCAGASGANSGRCIPMSILYFELIWPVSAVDELGGCQTQVFAHQRCLFWELQL